MKRKMELDLDVLKANLESSKVANLQNQNKAANADFDPDQKKKSKYLMKIKK